MNYSQPMNGTTSLHDYQQRAITHFYENAEVAAVMPMGAGKTVCALTAIAELLRDGEIKHATVIAPLRVARLVWPIEARKWGLWYLQINVVIGTPTEREFILAKHADIHVLTYDNLQWFMEKQPQWKTDLVVFDEITRLKNPSSKRAKAIYKWLQTVPMVWGLSGTIAPNGYQDLFMPAKLITRSKLWGKSFHAWRQQHFEKEPYNNWGWLLRPGHGKIIENEFASIAFRVDDEDLYELPELVINPINVELPDDAMRLYRQMLRDMLVQVNSGTVAAANAGVVTMKLRQISQGFIYGVPDNFVHDVKMDALKELVDSMNGEPLLIAYDFKEDLDRIRKEFNCPYIGAGVGDKESQELVHQWNKRKLPLLAVHPASAGHGLNMQDGGNNIAWYGLVWSLEQYSQLIKRIHRQGQLRRCFSHIILSDAGVDQQQLMALEGKQTLQDAAINALRAI